MESLNDKTIVITGASSGVGKALATELVKENCNLVLAARRIERLNVLKKELDNSSKILVIKTDVSKEKEVKNLFKQAINKFGKIDVLVNSAGKGLQKSFSKVSKDEWDSMMDTNLTGVFLCSKEASKIMVEKNIKGYILTVCSIAGIYGAPNYSTYCASKHGVAGLTRSMWLELRKKGINVKTIYPGRIETEFFNSYANKPSKHETISAKDVAIYIKELIKKNKFRALAKRTSNQIKRVKNILKGKLEK